MGKAVALEKKKKKGRPSLSDLQKRRPLPPPLPQQRQKNDSKRSLSPSQPVLNPNPKSTPRRITRRYVSLLESKEEEEEEDDDEKEEEEDDDNDDDGDERRKEKKMKLVLRLNRSSRPRSPSSLGNSRDRTTDDEAPGSDSNNESESGEKPPKKRTIHSVTEMGKSNLGNGSAVERVEKGKHDQNRERTTGRRPPGSLTGTPLPNEKMLLFILERLQKKDTYGVFSEPVDPEELPDYRDVIEHPMDFSTVKKKLSTGVYTTLEQFESDVFLICSNAMRYNAPETIYFRQARSIQELAKKDFQNIRQNGDGTEQDSRPPRGRPSLFKKFMQQSATKPSVEPAASDSDAAVANAGRDNSACPNMSNNHIKNSSASEKLFSLPDAAGRVTLSFRDSDMSTSFTENKFVKNVEVSGVMLRVVNVKHGRKPYVSEENRRETYNISSWSANRRDPIWTGLDIEKRQLMPVGLHVEHAYARSLARFAASLGPVALKIAACKIEKALPPGMRFGPGWIGETEAPPSRKSPVKTSPYIALQTVESKSETPEMIVPSKRPVSESHISPKISQGRPPAVNGTASLLSKENRNTSFSPGMYDTKIPLQNHQNSGVEVSPNGFISRFPLPPMLKPGQVSPATSAIRPSRPQGNMGLTSSMAIAEAVAAAHLLGAVSRNSNTTGMVTLEPQQPGLVDGKILTHGSNNPTHECVTEGRDGSDNQAGSMNSSHQQTSWRGRSLHQKPDSTPPDLNIGFQSPASPVQQSSGMLVDTQQPDLALQL